MTSEALLCYHQLAAHRSRRLHVCSSRKEVNATCLLANLLAHCCQSLQYTTSCTSGQTRADANCYKDSDCAACTVYLPYSFEVRDTTVNCYSLSLWALSTRLGAAVTVRCPLYRYCSAMLACNAAPTGIIESSILKSGVCSFSVVCRVVLPIPRKTKTP